MHESPLPVQQSELCMQATPWVMQHAPALQVPLQQSVLLAQLPAMSIQLSQLPAMQARPVQQSAAE